jgi:hypothetical protein
VTFANNTKNYTLSGVGGIAGTGAVDITGTGQVTFANSGNNYSGPTNISGGSQLRMVSATTGAINNSGTLSLGVTVNSQALVQNSSHTIGTAGHKILAVEAENFLTYTQNDADGAPPIFEVVSDPSALAGQQALRAAGSFDGVTNPTNINLQNYVTYNVKFTEPGTYHWYGRIRVENVDGNDNTATEDSVWFANADLGNGATNPQTLSTRLDLGAASSAVNSDGVAPTAAGAPDGPDALAATTVYDWYHGRGNNSGGAGGGFDRIVVSPNDVNAGTVFQFKMATREGGIHLDKFVFVQDPIFTGEGVVASFGALSDAQLDAVPVISTTQSETITTVGNILNVGGNFTMSSDSSVLNMLLSTSVTHDQINVAGTLVANGTLNLTAPSGLGVTAGDIFDIFTFSSVSGSFDMVNLPTLTGGLGWDTSNLLVNGQLSVVQLATPGDFDLDGDVDGRDFLLWQRNPSVGNLADWQTNYGSNGGPLSASTAVPEPSTVASVALMMCVAFMKRGHTKS